MLKCNTIPVCYVVIEKWKIKVILLRVFPNLIYENDR